MGSDDTPVRGDEYQAVASTLARSLKRWKAIRADSRYDKKDLCINGDSRFSAVKFEVSVDSWEGTYGHSGCSRVMTVGDPAIFKTAFCAVLTQNLVSLLEQTISKLNSQSKEWRQSRIRELEKETAGLRAVDNTKGEPDD